jgi:integrase
MANIATTTMILCKIAPGKWRRFKPFENPNGSYKSGHADIDGVSTPFKTFRYQLRSYDGGKVVYKNISRNPKLARNPTFARSQREVEQSKRKAKADAKREGLQVVEDDPTRQTLAQAAKLYVERTAKRGRHVAAEKYRLSLERFQKSAPQVMYVDQITEDHLLDYHAYLRKEFGNADRTVSNSHKHVKALLLFCGWAGGKSMEQRIGPPPRYDKTKPVAYHRDELSSLYASLEAAPKPRRSTDMDPRYLYTVLRTLQMAGLRKREASHLAWTDVLFKRGEIRIAAKPECRDCPQCRENNRGFRLKDREERIIPLHPELAVLLEERRKLAPSARLVFGTQKDVPCAVWLRNLKLEAHRAGLDCGHCAGCREYARTGRWNQSSSGCDRWTLHGFRRTYATTLHQQGVPLTDIRDLLGHSDIKTTERYLGSETSENLKQRVRSINW